MKFLRVALALLLFALPCAAESADVVFLDAPSSAVRVGESLTISIQPTFIVDPGWGYAWSVSSGSLVASDTTAEFTAPANPGYAVVRLDVLDESETLLTVRYFPILVYKQFAIVKADDFVSYDASLPDTWKQYLEYMSETRRLKHSVGIITNSLELYALSTDNDYTALIRSLHASGLTEFWHHGYDHSGTPEAAAPPPSLLRPAAMVLPPMKMAGITEFSGQPYAFQKAHLEDGLALSREVLGFPMHTFGAPFGASDATTLTVIEESTDIEVWLDGQAGSTKRVVPVNGTLVENPTGFPRVDQFNAAYNPSTPMIVMQVHPGFVEGGEDTFIERFDAWETILDTVEANASTFVTPFEYKQLFDDGEFPLHPDSDSDGDGVGDWDEGQGDEDGNGLPDFLDPDSDGTEGLRVRNVSVARTGAGEYGITFDLFGAPSDVADLVVELVDDAGEVTPLTALTGDLTGLVPATGLGLVWNAAAELGEVELEDVRIRITPQVTAPAQPAMVSVEAGSFQRGCPACSSGDSFPPIPVALDAFAISTFEVSNAELADVLDYALAEGYLFNASGNAYAGGDVYHEGQLLVALSNASAQVAFASGDFTPKTRDALPMDDHPALFVTWYGAVAYCNWLSEQAALTPAYELGNSWRLKYPFTNGYRLPTEAEWERAATLPGSPPTALFGFGIGPLSDARANYASDNPLGLTAAPFTTPVGYYDGNNGTTDSPSPAGAYDLSGNAAEWVHDRYAPNEAQEEAERNPRGSDTRPKRVVKGGGWSNAEAALENAAREQRFASHASNRIGFRVARSLASGSGLSGNFNIDTVPPEASVTLVGTPEPNDFAIAFDVHFTEPVEGVVQELFTLDTTGTLEAPPFISAFSGSGQDYQVTVSTGIMQGTVALTLEDAGATIRDAADNPLEELLVSSTPFALDTLAPAIQSITLIGAPSLNASVVQFVVSFSKDVVLVEPDDFAVETTGSVVLAPEATAVEGSGSARIVTVAVNTLDGQLGLRANDLDNSVQDGNGRPLGRVEESGLVHTADTVPPVLTAFNLLGTPLPNAAEISVAVSFSEPITGLAASHFEVIAAGTVDEAPEITGLTGADDAYVLTVDTGIVESGLELAFTPDAGILDAAGNAVVDAAESGVLFTSDTIAPTAESIELIGEPVPNSAEIVFEVIFSEAMFGVSEDDFLPEPGGTIDVAPTILEVSGSGSIYTVRLDTGAMEGSIGLGFLPETASDFAGNAAVVRLDSVSVHAADTRPPTLLSIEALTESPTASDTLQFRLVFSEPVSGLNGEGDTNLVVTATGLTYATATTSFDGNLTTLLVVLEGLSAGSGSVGLNVRDALSEPPGNILDQNGNPLADVIVADAVVTIDRTRPEVRCKGVTLSLNETGTAVASLASFDNGSTDDSGSVQPISASQTEFGCEHLGVNNVTVTFADELGNTATCDTFVIVIDLTQVCVEPVEGEGSLEGEGGEEGEGSLEGEGEGNQDGEGGTEGEGEGEGVAIEHSADWNGEPDGRFDLAELLRVIQIYNAGSFCCAIEGERIEDGYLLGACDTELCTRHTADYSEPEWVLTLSELLRVVQLFNLGAFVACDEGASEDGFCAAAALE